MKVAFSLEAPNAAIDTGKVSDVDPTLGVEGWTKWPDFVGNLSFEPRLGPIPGGGHLALGRLPDAPPPPAAIPPAPSSDGAST